MDEFATNINIQTLIGLFFLVLFVVIGLFGFLLWRFEFLNGKEFYFSHNLGRILMLSSSILIFSTVLMLIYIRVTM